MVHGSISGVRKGNLMIFEYKEKVTVKVYSAKVLLGVHQFICQMERTCYQYSVKAGLVEQAKFCISFDNFGLVVFASISNINPCRALPVTSCLAGHLRVLCPMRSLDTQRGSSRVATRVKSFQGIMTLAP